MEREAKELKNSIIELNTSLSAAKGLRELNAEHANVMSKFQRERAERAAAAKAEQQKQAQAQAEAEQKAKAKRKELDRGMER